MGAGQDVERRLAQYRDINLIHLRFKRSEAEILAEMDQGGLSGTFRGIAKNIQAPLIEITMRNEKFSRQPLPQRLFDSVKNLARNPKTKESLDIFEIKGFNLDIKLYDSLLFSQICIPQEITYKTIENIFRNFIKDFTHDNIYYSWFYSNPFNNFV